MQKHHSHSEEDTIEFSRQLANDTKTGQIYCLHGEMGMGKSVFARAFIRTLMRDDTLEVPSPTFTLVQTYQTDTTSIWHFDLYRLKTREEIYEIGWEEALIDNIVLIEWPERLESLKPAHAIDIQFTAPTDTSREIRVTKGKV